MMRAMVATRVRANKKGTPSKTEESALGAHIRRLWESRGLNKSQFAKLVGIAWTTVNAWQFHGAKPAHQQLTAINVKLELEPDEERDLQAAWFGVKGGAEFRAQQKAQLDASVGELFEGDHRLKELLTRATDPARHTFEDALNVYRALFSGGWWATEAKKEGAISVEGAAFLLDLAAELRKQHLLVEPGALLFMAVTRYAIPTKLRLSRGG